MSYGKPGKLMKQVRRSIKKRAAKHRAAVRQAQANAKKTERAQKAIAKDQPKVTAGELLGSGDWKWEGSGLSPDTVMEAVWGENRWEYVPAKTTPRKTTRAASEKEPEQCRGETKNGTPCQRIGNCPVRSHKKNKV